MGTCMLEEADIRSLVDMVLYHVENKTPGVTAEMQSVIEFVTIGIDQAMPREEAKGTVVLRVIGIADELLPASDYVFLASYDPYASDAAEPLRIGGGVPRLTRFLMNAMTFDSEDAANEFRTQRHPTVPTRGDGLPNRPLTALTMGPQQISECTALPDGTATSRTRIVRITDS